MHHTIWWWGRKVSQQTAWISTSWGWNDESVSCWWSLGATVAIKIKFRYRQDTRRSSNEQRNQDSSTNEFSLVLSIKKKKWQMPLIMRHESQRYTKSREEPEKSLKRESLGHLISNQEMKITCRVAWQTNNPFPWHEKDFSFSKIWRWDSSNLLSWVYQRLRRQTLLFKHFGITSE